MDKELELLKDSAISKYKNKEYKQALIEFNKIKQKNLEYLEKNCKLYYLWSIYYVEVKLDKKMIESNYDKFQNNVKYILKHEKKHGLLYNITIMSVIDFLSSKKNFDLNDLNKWLSKINPDELKSEPYTFKNKNVKNVTSFSQMEKWYSIKIKTLENLKEYNECIKYCDMAFEKISVFHNDNDIWFQRSKALCLKELGKNEEAIIILKKILNKKNDWFIQNDIGNIYLEMGKIKEAKKNYIDAALNAGQAKMKVKLFWNLANIFENQQKIDESNLHKKCVLLIRNTEGWKLSHIEKEFENKIPKQELEGLNEKKILNKLKNIWEDEKWSSENVIEGTIENILPNGQAGFVSTKNKKYYFQIKEFRGKKENLVIGTKVNFYLGVGFDKKKNKETKVAVNIKLLKQ